MMIGIITESCQPRSLGRSRRRPGPGSLAGPVTGSPSHYRTGDRPSHAAGGLAAAAPGPGSPAAWPHGQGGGGVGH
eukprot:758617-Hanusia_phi.AAC.10